MTLEIIWGNGWYLVPIRCLLPHATHPDGAQLTLGTDVLNLGEHTSIIAASLRSAWTILSPIIQDISARYAPKRH
ncbi:hypothetical protein [Candidatus Nitrosotenuis uzonensis]|uniref:Uncharacterized protein n=1 Tax=Candidatus Nitrosotenuis uzonensis TaxID=1407055 RepID=A0A812F1C3_9ARCH|nr:hypothetical protein [Candidatus Nitrosotenuis uzonensis]CAE6493491.1 hypothetical protein NUZ5A_50168 [Candidatus Nitrosotenuis uzonensis]